MVARRHQPATDPACTERVHEVDWAELPLSCPKPEMAVWNAHPRVYLPIHRNTEAHCPYCGTHYKLKAPMSDQPLPAFANSEIENCFLRARQRVRDAQG